MVFSSYLFLFVFLPAVLLAYRLAGARLRIGVLTVASYLFYAWGEGWFALLMLLVSVSDYANGRIIGAARSRTVRRTALGAALTLDLGLLFVFKYLNFGLENYRALLETLGIGGGQYAGFFRIVLPLGISFYTFQSLSYVFDVYRKRIPPVRSLLEYTCFVSMFPQLVAGPIVRARELAPQLSKPELTLELFARGVAFFCLGLGKKVLLANPCGAVADAVFGAGSPGAGAAWYGVTAYAFQIYFDFSGYSDMAVGLGMMLGFRLPRNFNAPFQSVSLTDFWRRWHLTLSRWLRDYLYIPLGGSRCGRWKNCRNVLVVMLLAGAWHGAGWNFLWWGACHGVWLAAERLHGKGGFFPRLPRPVRIGLTFFALLFTWVIFRAETPAAAARYFAGMFGFGGGDGAAAVLNGAVGDAYSLAGVLAAALVVWAAPQSWRFTRCLTWGKLLWCALLLAAAIALLTVQRYQPFIYFNF